METIGKGVAQGGTYNNNKPGVAAAYATLDLMQKEPVHETIARRGRRLMDGIYKIFSDSGIPVCISGYPAMFSFAAGVEKVTNQRDWEASDKQFYLRSG